jgi:hypothetical protein
MNNAQNCDSKNANMMPKYSISVQVSTGIQFLSSLILSTFLLNQCTGTLTFSEKA